MQFHVNNIFVQEIEFCLILKTTLSISLPSRMFPEVIHTYPIGQKDTQTVCLVGGALLNWPIMIVTMLIKKATLTI